MRAIFNQADLSGEIFNLGWGKEIKDMEIFEIVRDALALYTHLKMVFGNNPKTILPEYNCNQDLVF